MDRNKIIGANIRYERRLRNISTEDLAQIIGITPSFLGIIERGQKGLALKKLCKLADFFSISMDTMLNRDIEGMIERDDFDPLSIKRDNVKNQVEDLNEAEVDFVNVTISLLRKLKKYDPNER